MTVPGAGVPCTGEGRNWALGTGAAICPVCHRGVTALTGTRAKTLHGSQAKWANKHLGPVPPHTMRAGPAPEPEPGPDECVGGKCTDIYNLCTRHQTRYQARYGRASNE